MCADIVIRHAVSITGKVSDALIGSPLAGTLVEITHGPPAFEDMRSMLASDPGWRMKNDRIDRTFDHNDGTFFFVDLPSGSYHLKFSLPQAGRRYGDFQADAATVLGQRDAGGRIITTRIDAVMTPTQILGHVTRKDNHQPIANAKVSLQGDETAVQTDAKGQYLITDLTAIKPTVVVTADKYKPFSQGLTLTPGVAQTLDIKLDPVP